jgi:hypothetical protein
MKKGKKVVILFVEGDSEKEFYQALFAYYQASSKSQINCSIKIVNIKGIGRYEKKVPSKLRNELIEKYRGFRIVVCCCYDIDVFELAEKPPTNWSIVRESVSKLGIDKFLEIPASKMIEDWFLCDTKGLCNFLGIKKTPQIKGRDGYEKMKFFFKRGNKTYQKGSNCHKFIPYLNIALIRSKIKGQLSEFENEIGAAFADKKENKSRRK